MALLLLRRPKKNDCLFSALPKIYLKINYRHKVVNMDKNMAEKNKSINPYIGDKVIKNKPQKKTTTNIHLLCIFGNKNL